MAKIKGLGSTLKLDGVAIGQLVSMSGPGSDVSTTETTDLSATWREYLPTVANGGNVSGELHYDPRTATHASLSALVNAPAIETWTQEFSNGSEYSYSGILTAFEVGGMEVDGVLTASITIQITGAITVTAGSA